MRAADDVEDYRLKPVGAYLQLPHGLVFCARPDLWGFALWGKPSPADVARILPLIAPECLPSVRPHPLLADFRLLEDANPDPLGLLVQFLQKNAGPIGKRLTRVAVVRPDGLPGMVVAGFHAMIGGTYPGQIFGDLTSATSWLDRQAVADELADAIERASHSSATIVKLRQWLHANLAGATLRRAARAIGRTPRSLQRDLHDASSSFQREVEGARLLRAQHLLARTAMTLTEIAYDVGCSSPQHFSVLFRRLTGMPPSAWRALHR